MGYEIKWALNKMSKTEDKNLPIMSVVKVKRAGAFHESTPQYQVTPLTGPKNVAEYLSLAEACIRGKSYRFRLNTFKVLGGSYVIARYIAGETKRDTSQMPHNVLTSKEFHDEFGQATFFSTIDGNHGRGVTWAANRLGQKCVIRMPVGSTKNRRCHIGDEGAGCTIEKINCDDCVRIVAEEAKHAKRDVIIQDTAWEGYEEIPPWTMQDYSTMADEAMGQSEEHPIHVFVQAGAGSLAGGVMGYLANKCKKNPPVMVMVETEPAACLYRDAEAVDGEIHIVDGEMPTIVTGLCCDEPDITSWDILKNHVTTFLAVNDDVAREDMRVLAAPSKGDLQVVSGESGATTFGALATIMKDEPYCRLRLELGLSQDPKVFMFSTKGNADSDRYKTIVWKGGLK